MSDLPTTELEIRLAFLERHQEEQDRVIHSLRSEVAHLRQELQRLGARLAPSASAAASASPADERPPHY